MSVTGSVLFTGKDHMKKPTIKQLLLLHLSILIFSLNGIFSKLAAGSINECGLVHVRTWIFLGLMLINCMVYALFWQQNLKHLDVNVAYAHRAVYNVWSLIWAAAVFAEKITVGNILGTILIICGVVVIQNE